MALETDLCEKVATIPESDDRGNPSASHRRRFL